MNTTEERYSIILDKCYRDFDIYESSKIGEVIDISRPLIIDDLSFTEAELICFNLAEKYAYKERFHLAKIQKYAEECRLMYSDMPEEIIDIILNSINYD